MNLSIPSSSILRFTHSFSTLAPICDKRSESHWRLLCRREKQLWGRQQDEGGEERDKRSNGATNRSEFAPSQRVTSRLA